jgi:hypothetical protein
VAEEDSVAYLDACGVCVIFRWKPQDVTPHVDPLSVCLAPHAVGHLVGRDATHDVVCKTCWTTDGRRSGSSESRIDGRDFSQAIELAPVPIHPPSQTALDVTDRYSSDGDEGVRTC